MTKQPLEQPYRFRNLLVFLLLYLFGSPFLSAYPSFSVVAHLILSIMLCVAVYTVQKQQNYRTIAMILLLPVLLLYWLGTYTRIEFSRPGSLILLTIFFLLLILSFASQLMKSTRISHNEIFATLCLYLIIGLFWGTLHALLYEISPGSYAGTLLDDPGGARLSTFNYFSLVTLTTLGYGDITPQTPGAAALCQLEAIIGQFYTAVVIAWLVGNFVADRQKKERP